MNPIFDLVIIGIIAVIVLLNLYHSRVPSNNPTSLFSGLREKCTTLSLFEQKPPVQQHLYHEQ